MKDMNYLEERVEFKSKLFRDLWGNGSKSKGIDELATAVIDSKNNGSNVDFINRNITNGYLSHFRNKTVDNHEIDEEINVIANHITNQDRAEEISQQTPPSSSSTSTESLCSPPKSPNYSKLNTPQDFNNHRDGIIINNLNEDSPNYTHHELETGIVHDYYGIIDDYYYGDNNPEKTFDYDLNNYQPIQYIYNNGDNEYIIEQNSRKHSDPNLNVDYLQPITESQYENVNPTTDNISEDNCKSSGQIKDEKFNRINRIDEDGDVKRQIQGDYFDGINQIEEGDDVKSSRQIKDEKFNEINRVDEGDDDKRNIKISKVSNYINNDENLKTNPRLKSISWNNLGIPLPEINPEFFPKKMHNPRDAESESPTDVRAHLMNNPGTPLPDINTECFQKKMHKPRENKAQPQSQTRNRAHSGIDPHDPNGNFQSQPSSPMTECFKKPNTESNWKSRMTPIVSIGADSNKSTSDSIDNPVKTVNDLRTAVGEIRTVDVVENESLDRKLVLRAKGNGELKKKEFYEVESISAHDAGLTPHDLKNLTLSKSNGDKNRSRSISSNSIIFRGWGIRSVKKASSMPEYESGALTMEKIRSGSIPKRRNILLSLTKTMKNLEPEWIEVKKVDSIDPHAIVKGEDSKIGKGQKRKEHEEPRVHFPESYRVRRSQSKSQRQYVYDINETSV